MDVTIYTAESITKLSKRRWIFNLHVYHTRFAVLLSVTSLLYVRGLILRLTLNQCWYGQKGKEYGNLNTKESKFLRTNGRPLKSELRMKALSLSSSTTRWLICRYDQKFLKMARADDRPKLQSIFQEVENQVTLL